MKVRTSRVSHDCLGIAIEADVVREGRYWWGYIGGVKLECAIERCPYCGNVLPVKATEEKV